MKIKRVSSRMCLSAMCMTIVGQCVLLYLSPESPFLHHVKSGDVPPALVWIQFFLFSLTLVMCLSPSLILGLNSCFDCSWALFCGVDLFSKDYDHRLGWGRGLFFLNIVIALDQSTILAQGRCDRYACPWILLIVNWTWTRRRRVGSVTRKCCPLKGFQIGYRKKSPP